MKTLVNLILFVFFVTCTDFAQAFTLTYNASNKGYSNPEIAIDINQSSCPASVDLEGIVRDSVEVWNRLPSSNLKNRCW